MDGPHQKIAQILRVDKDALIDLEKRLSEATQKKDVIEKIVYDNEAIMRARLDSLSLGRRSPAKDVYNGIISRVESDDYKIFEALGRPSAASSEDWNKVIKTISEFSAPPMGFFLKNEKASELLRQEPPATLLKILDYGSVDEMLRKENLYEVWSALRFIEGGEWLNNVFFKQYETLKPGDFEHRPVSMIAMPERWITLSEGFISKKHYNISHLKELGLVFVLPLQSDISGQTLRNFSMIFHYLNEVPYYSDLFQEFARDENTFAKNLVALLRGDAVSKQAARELPATPKSRWLIIQQYLAKDDPNDWRLFEPHLNPEVIHWEKAEEMLIRCRGKLKDFTFDLSFWHDTGWVGEYFPTEAGMDVLVSFNLVDAVMSLVQEKEMAKYLYHHQEALWNKIFKEYFGEDILEATIKKNIIPGWIEI